MKRKKCITCGDELHFDDKLSDGSPAICMEYEGYDSIPCAVKDIIKRLKKLERKNGIN